MVLLPPQAQESEDEETTTRLSSDLTRLSGPVGAFAAGLCERYRIFAVSLVNIICKLVKVRDVQSVVLTKNIMQDSVPNVICEFSHYFC